MKKRKRIIYGTLILLASTILIWKFFIGGTNTTIQFETAKATVKTISNSITATGTIEPITQVEVGTQVSGVIENIYVDYNTTVKKGQLIAEIDKTTLLAQVEEKKASLASAKNELQFQESNYNRTKLLHEKKSVSDVDYENALYKYNSAKANVKRIKSELNRVQTNLNYASIYSPIDGVVLSRAVDEGQTVAASFNTPTLFTIANDLTKMQVIADVDEADIGQVKEGQKVMFTVDAFPDDEFAGTVTQIRLEPLVSSNVVTYSVVVEAPNPDLKLMPGMTASITAYTQIKEDALTIPAKAIRFNPDKDMLNAYFAKNGLENFNSDINNTKEKMKVIWIKDGIDLKATEVETGMSDGANIEVKKGIKPGQEVVLSMQNNIERESNKEESSGSPFMPKPPGSNKK